MKQKLLPYLSLLITCLGALGIGVEIIISETVYPEIDEFINCPLWYQILMYLFIFIVFIGIVFSIVFRRKDTTSNVEVIIELVLIVLGIIGMFFSLDRNETYYKDVIICVGGCLFSLGFFTGVSTIIGLSIHKK